jgi:predicted acylesterase/phospholipase RssA
MRDLGLTLGGGGSRSFYQIGLLEAWGDKLWPRVAAVASVSAGAAIATMLVSGRLGAARSHWDGLRTGLRKNLDPRRPLRGEPLAPHGRIYRSTVLHALEEGGLEAVQSAPFPIYVLCAEPPARLPITAATWLGLGAYALEKKVDPRRLHPRAALGLGFRPLVVDARLARTANELADLVLGSSSTPPFTPVGVVNGRRVLDGGIVDNAPADLAEEHPDVRKNLVLLTRPYPKGVGGARGRRLYIEPSRPVPVDRWDYTEQAPIDETLRLGLDDAARYTALLDAWLA